MTPEQLKAIRERCEAATAGPWADNGTSIDQHWTAVPKDWATVVGLEECGSPYQPWQRLVLKESDAAFIAHARTDVPALLDLVASLQERVKELEGVFGLCVVPLEALRITDERRTYPIINASVRAAIYAATDATRAYATERALAATPTKRGENEP